ncbi:hypothetical protein [Nakamurella leprariae]|uniref:Uncharacterized protein n=1 Tax=Nakamurella leprariae TaxID=2803911 RepID=A0A939BVJ0_9ACTN|nr:hypothetical protein [Nakamurella leprariae]MBM9466568.1 hypothetical protein [Nakamurella leprariae]
MKLVELTPARWSAPRRAAGAVASAVALIGSAFGVVSLVAPRITPWDVLRDPASPLVRLVDVGAEGNVHTWFDVAVLTLGAAAGAVTAASRTAPVNADGRGW